MKKILSTALFVMLLFTSCVSNTKGGETQMEETKKDYELVFYDDFEGTELDKSKWEPCPEWERQTHMKNHGWWADECVSVKDSMLILECKKRASDGKLISGAVRTISKDFTRTMLMQEKGIWEIKFKAEPASGLWYAFWMMADNSEKNIGGGAVNGAELDCFELLPGKSWWKKNGKDVNEAHRLMSTIHWDAYGAAHKMQGTDGINVLDNDPDFYDNWHVFKFVWTDAGYTCFLDDKELWFMKGSDYGGTCKKPGYTKISAEFGDWTGPTDPEILEGKSKNFYVDYVKIYKEL